MDTDSPFVWNWNAVAAVVIILVVGSTANAAGVGGGAIFIPVLQALIGFGLKDATALSQALITAGAVASVAVNVFKRSPADEAEPLINFSAALSLTPAVLAGISVGVLMNTALPVSAITLLLLLMMAVMVRQTLAKGGKMWRAESSRRAQTRAAAPVATVASSSALHKRPAAVRIPLATVAALAATWAVFAAIQIQRSHVIKCSPADWALLAAQLGFMAVVSFSTLVVPQALTRIWRSQESSDGILGVVVDSGGVGSEVEAAAALSQPLLQTETTVPAATEGGATDAVPEPQQADTRQPHK